MTELERLKELEQERQEELAWIAAHGPSAASSARLNTIHVAIYRLRQALRAQKRSH